MNRTGAGEHTIRKATMNIMSWIAVPSFGLLATAGVLAQSISIIQPSVIEVATVKASKPDATGINNHFGRELFSYTNVDLQTLIETIYRLKDYQVLNAPGWLRSERWDIQAKTTGPTTMRQKLDALKLLIAERFHLKFHHDTRDLPVYSLVVAKNGPKILKSDNTDNVPGGISNSSGKIVGHKCEISMLADFLAADLNMPIQDKTQLSGRYDFRVEWAPDAPRQMPKTDVVDGPDALLPADALRPSIFTAVQEQLGLKLEVRKDKVQVIVIDSVEKPSEN
jgi:uncharacterized protein (TIGR03435 family)